MNILYFLNCGTMYGANKSLIELAEELQKRNIKVYMFIPEMGSVERVLRKKKIPYKKICYELCTHPRGQKNDNIGSLYRNIKKLPTIKKYLKEWNIDIIHSNASNVDIGAIVSKIYNLPHVWHIREFMEDHSNHIYNFKCLNNYLFRTSKKVICISNAVYNKYYGIRGTTNFVMLYDGIGSQYTINKKAILRDEVVTLIICGVISQEKGQYDAIRAMKILYNSGNYNIRLFIIGRGTNKYEKKLNDYVILNQLTNIVSFIDYQENLKMWRENADIALVCSKNEGLGRVAIESMMSDCIVVGTNNTGTKELLVNEKYGYLYQYNNSTQLAKTIQNILENRGEARKKVKDAKNMVLNVFNMSDYASKIISIYNEIL